MAEQQLDAFDESLQRMYEYMNDHFEIRIVKNRDKTDRNEIEPDSYSIDITHNGSQWQCICCYGIDELIKLHMEIGEFLIEEK